MATVLRDMKFSSLYDTANLQRPMTLDEFTHAKDMYAEFEKMLTEFRVKSNDISTFVNYIKHLNTCDTRNLELDEDWSDKYVDIKFNIDDTLVEYILITVSQDQDGQLHISSSMDIAIPEQDYEYECIEPNEELTVLRTKEEVLRDITGNE